MVVYRYSVYTHFLLYLAVSYRRSAQDGIVNTTSQWCHRAWRRSDPARRPWGWTLLAVASWMLCGVAVFFLSAPPFSLSFHFPSITSVCLDGRTAFPPCRHILPERDIALSGTYRLYNINSLLERKINNVQNKPKVFQVRSRVERETQILLEWPTSRFEY